MATIRKRTTKSGASRYQAIIRLEEGKASKAFSTKTAAKAWASRVENEIRLGTYSGQQESSKHTVSEMIDRYMQDHAFQQKRDRRNQERQLEFWRGRIGGKKLIDVSRALIIEVRDELASEDIGGKTRAPATVNRFLASISHCFSKALEWEWVEANPVKGVSRLTEPKGRDRYLSDEERQRLLTASEKEPVLYLIVVLALSTGARRGEIMGLKWKDVDLKAGRAILHETKNGSKRALPIVGHVAELMAEHRKVRRLDSDLVFPDPVVPSKPWNFEAAWRVARREAELEDFRFHDLRHSAASYLAMGGASLAEIAEILGHKTLAMVKRYSHLSDSHVSSVVSKMNAQIFG